MILSPPSATTVPQTNSSPNAERTNLSIHTIAPSVAELTPHAIHYVDHCTNPGLPTIQQRLQLDHSGTPILFPASPVILTIALTHTTQHFLPTFPIRHQNNLDLNRGPDPSPLLHVHIRPPSFNIRLSLHPALSRITPVYPPPNRPRISRVSSPSGYPHSNDTRS
ncbi:hypothetical protein PILCRDRAFT_825978 [Piloderma croceum F 1598]|uniref:Uncharacterized protein n=1 Tax=Piloderma croceum (strain F 1598) TaxID=765440 RepID=A0A0C3FAJ6_PILCF|nr:hypothetical protein PILCRDRAFT_825978 [Piloderma croceum F 1598]